MKRFFLLTLALMLLTISAGAEIADRIGTAEDGEGAIYRFTTPDGQQIIYTAWCEEGYILYEDVNFDGVDDLVALTHLGAANAGFAFYVATDDGYLLVNPDEALFNYQLDAEQGMVVTSANDGWAGVMRRMGVYEWEGASLRLLRTAVSEASALYPDRVAMRVTDMSGEEPAVLWETHVPVIAEDALREAMEEMELRLRLGSAVVLTPTYEEEQP